MSLKGPAVGWLVLGWLVGCVGFVGWIGFVTVIYRGDPLHE
jgi:hypothetical protein